MAVDRNEMTRPTNGRSHDDDEMTRPTNGRSHDDDEMTRPEMGGRMMMMKKHAYDQ